MNTQAFKGVTVLVLNEKIEKDNEKSFQEIAKVELPIPLLADYGIETEQAKDEDGSLSVEDGIPVYVDDAYNWLQSAIINQVKAQSRNKFIKGALKDGMKLATTFEELTTVGERSGEALKARHKAKASFKAYLEAANKKPVVVKLLGDLFGDVNSVSVAKDEFVDALVSHVAKWIVGLDEVNKVRFTRTIEKLQEAFESRTGTMDDLK